MAKLPKKVSDRLSKNIGTFQRVLRNARDRDVNESDTVTIITDMLAELFGFDKYSEVTSEQSIRGTYCDLAVKIDGKIKYLIEVKAIGIGLKENHLRQAVSYGAHEGISFVVLTNGIRWAIYGIRFEQPISHDFICAFDLLDINPKRTDDIEQLYLLCKEGLTKSKSAIEEFQEYSQIVNRFTIAALIRSDVVLGVIRRELRRLASNAKIDIDDIEQLLPEVLKRELLDGDEVKKASRLIKRASNKVLRNKQSNRRSRTDSNSDSSNPTLNNDGLANSDSVSDIT